MAFPLEFVLYAFPSLKASLNEPPVLPSVYDHYFSPSQLKGGLLFYFSNKAAPSQRKHAAEGLHLAEHSSPSAFTA